LVDFFGRRITSVKDASSVTLEGEGGGETAGIAATFQNFCEDGTLVVRLRTLVVSNFLTEFVGARILRLLTVPKGNDGVGDSLYVTGFADPSGQIAPGIGDTSLIQKPFRLAGLREEVQRAFKRPPDGARENIVPLKKRRR
jgi:hypothetical protein